MQLLQARWLLLDSDTLLEGGGLLIERGRVRALLENPGAVQRALAARDLRVTDLGEAVLTPGLVNAHAHLDLTALAGRVPALGGFGAWIARLLEERGTLAPALLAEGVGAGAERLLATGTTWVGDIDSMGAAESVLAGHRLGAVLLREVLDAGDPARSEEALARVLEPLDSRPGLVEGLSPHAPFTVSPALLARLGQLAHTRHLPVAMHWSETEAEVQWLEQGSGPLAGLGLTSPRRPGLDLIEEAGLLQVGTALVHGNHPRPGEPGRLAAAGVVLVHCPGTHRFFERERAPLEGYLEAGVTLALGTDSRASNGDLDMRREMALLRESHPGLAPKVVWDMATLGGARALGLEAGRIRVGARADLAAFATTGRDRVAILDQLTGAIPELVGVWPASSEPPPKEVA